MRAHFQVTNTGTDAVCLVAARLTRPAVSGTVAVRHSDNDMWGTDSLPSGKLMWAQASFFAVPPIHTAGADLVADVVIVDDLAREHRQRVVFNHH